MDFIAANFSFLGTLGELAVKQSLSSFAENPYYIRPKHYRPLLLS